MAQLILASGPLLAAFPIPLLKRMLTVLQHVVYNYSVRVQEFEETQGCYWATFQSCLECLYEPLDLSEQDKCEEGTPISLTRMSQKLSVTILLQFLRNSFGRRIHVNIIVKESLLDYIIPLPWILPAQYGIRAKNVVQEVAKFTSIQPPTLVSLAKASIAINKCGLHKLNSMDSISLLYNNLLD